MQYSMAIQTSFFQIKHLLFLLSSFRKVIILKIFILYLNLGIVTVLL